MNYNMSIAEITSKMVPGIGKEIGERIQEFKSTNNSDSNSTVAQIATEFKTAVMDAIKSMNPGNTNSAAIGEQLNLLSQMVREQQNSNSLQEKLLRAAAN
jgi:Sec-independent protein translocase protein TatA